MRHYRWSIVGALACSVPVACADPCIDDGLGQSECPQSSGANGTEGATDSSTETTPSTATIGTVTMGTVTQGGSGGQTSGPTDSGTGSDSDTDGADGTATDGETETGGGMLWCRDADGDGYGDPDDCRQSDEPVDGSVPNGDDCDDSNPETYPGAAPNDDPAACMQDEDGDDWGDDEPPPGVDPGSDCADDNANAFPGAAEQEDPPDLCAEDEDDDGWGDLDPPPGIEPGSDCDDTNADAFPGAAPNEDPPDLCTVDADGDGWGDANPGGGGGGPGPSSGSDCYDTNSDLNPDTLQLTALSPFQGLPFQPRTIDTVDTGDASLSPFVVLETPMGGIPDVNVVTATLNEFGEIYANDLNTVQLYSVEYAGICMMGQGVIAPVGMSYGAPGDVVCGLEFGSDGMLYGVDHADQLLVFDPVMGQVANTFPLEVGGMPLDINSCGMAFDCTEDRLLIANGIDQSIYSVDLATGAATVVRDLDADFPAPWLPTGLEYDPVSRNAYVSVGASLWEVDLDSMDPPVLVGFYGQQVSNLQYLPICI